MLDPAALIPLPEKEGWEFLTHATRACDGPWPGQSRSEYLDSLLAVDKDANHSPLAALVRIVSQRRLHASNQSIRGRFAVVSFTAVPLLDLPDLRVFRSHRGRWDFEPYGICIRKKWLVDRGARPVLYNPETAWKELPEVDRPFFQLANSQSRPQDAAAARPPLDWTVECEWRHVGNVNLSELEPGDAFVFVPTATDAIALQAVSPWPVCVLSTSKVEQQNDRLA